MKVIVSTPRTGSTFYTRYLWVTNPDYECFDEYFQPYLYPKDKNKFDITTERLKNLKNNVIIKILAGKETDSRVWEFLQNKNIPITFLKRKNIKRQFLSFGISCLNDIWTKFNKLSHGINRRNILNTDIKYKKGIYEKNWFDNLVYRIKKLDYLQSKLVVKEVLFYEDIIKYNYPKNKETEDKVPIKQNILSDDELINFFDNKDQVNIWLDLYIKEKLYDHTQ